MKKNIILVLFLIIISNLTFGATGKIISAAPSITESLFYMGYGDKIVGRTVYDEYPPEVKKIEVIGDMANYNAEKIIKLAPEYVIFESFTNEKLLKILNNTKIKTLSFESPKSVENIIDNMEKLNKTLDNTKFSTYKIKELRKNLENYKLNSKKLPTQPKVYFSLGAEQIEYTAGKETFIDDAITIAGGKNIVTKVGWTISLEELILSQPDIIIAEEIVYNQMKNNPKYKKLKALQEGKVIIVPSSISIPSPRFILETIKIIQDGLLKYSK